MCWSNGADSSGSVSLPLRLVVTAADADDRAVALIAVEPRLFSTFACGGDADDDEEAESDGKLFSWGIVNGMEFEFRGMKTGLIVQIDGTRLKSTQLSINDENEQTEANQERQLTTQAIVDDSLHLTRDGNRGNEAVKSTLCLLSLELRHRGVVCVIKNPQQKEGRRKNGTLRVGLQKASWSHVGINP